MEHETCVDHIQHHLYTQPIATLSTIMKSDVVTIEYFSYAKNMFMYLTKPTHPLFTNAYVLIDDSKNASLAPIIMSWKVALFTYQLIATSINITVLEQMIRPNINTDIRCNPDTHLYHDVMDHDINADHPFAVNTSSVTSFIQTMGYTSDPFLSLAYLKINVPELSLFPPTYAFHVNLIP